MTSWLQYNVRLSRRGGSAEESARSLFRSFGPPLARWRRERSLDCFFFMRKAPDVRMRLRGADLDAEVVDLLEELHQGRAIGRFFASTYEPEVHLFGGERAMALVHGHFDADTRAWMALAGDSSLLPILLHDLFLRTLGSNTEAWDVWWNLSALLPARFREAATTVEVAPLDRPGRTKKEAQVVARYQRANDRLAKGLSILWEREALECGLRGLLAFVALFTFNRHGFDGAKQACLARTFIETHSPHRGLRK